MFKINPPLQEALNKTLNLKQRLTPHGVSRCYFIFYIEVSWATSIISKSNSFFILRASKIS